MSNDDNLLKASIRRVAKALPGVENKDPSQYRLEELQSIEKRRRRILLHVEKPFWKVLTYWDGTVWRFLFLDPLFWTTIVIYVVVRVVLRIDESSRLDQLANEDINILGGFLSFFLVFYVNQNHKRFFGLYGDAMACKGRIFDTATLAVTTLPYAKSARLIRYMNAAHAAGYVGLSKIYPSDSYFSHVNDALGLLTKEERARLDDINLDKGGSCNREIIVWCMREVQTAQREGLLDNELANNMRSQILQLRAKIGSLYNAKDLPIPFFYIHFIVVLTTLYLPLFAVTMAVQIGDSWWTGDVIAGLIVVLQAIFVIGLRVLGMKMNDPFGDDLIDLSVMHYVDFTWTQSNRILLSHFPAEEASDEVEQSLVRHRTKPVGGAWEDVNKQESGSIETGVSSSGVP
jgi:predicted membrane chloride channel (bestrophin family)